MIIRENIEIIHRFLQVTKAPFKEMLAQLLGEYKSVYTPVRMVIFGAPADNEEYVERFAFIREAVKGYFKENAPLVSYVAQPPQSMGLVMEVHEVVLTPQDMIGYRTQEDTPYITIEREGCKRLFLSGVTGDVLRQSIREQSDEVFSRFARVLEAEKMPVSTIVRQWNYIEKITAYDVTGRQHYQNFNDARSLFYQTADWTTGYPAATGIGTQWGGIMVDADVLLCEDRSVRVCGVDNPLQVAAHAYSQKVLLGEKDVTLSQKTTPKFERAKAIWKEDHGFVYVSGTAAIRGEQSLEGVGIEQQTVTTLENIEYLVSHDNLNRAGIPVTEDASLITFRVYVKRWEDMEKARKVVTERYPTLPAIYTLTDVCRSELLIEIEGMGILR
ncbi:hypothetical protein [Bacteroides sp. UBA939]|uniref:chorismate transformation enzyme, FkbO/Hyg5 family n=1 Tax=Bacteroides sp. UBA939 TaxID=1946092 RepID=UPI0025B7CC50|nr:hypothetical protein [Bacteroides sp. UBA939]